MGPNKTALSYLTPLFAVPVFVAAVWAIHRELQGHRYRDVVAALHAFQPHTLLTALGLTALSYFILTAYDTMGLRFVGRKLAYRRIALASFIGYAFSNSLGFPLLTGVPIRYRLYSGWGLSAIQITQLIAFYTTTFWIGFFTIGALVLLLAPPQLPGALHLPWVSVRLLGLLFLAAVAAYFIASIVRRKPLRIRSLELQLPRPPLPFAQAAAGALDWLVAAGVAYVLLPAGHGLAFPAFLGIFLLAQMAGLLSHVPGGLGVFEAIVLLSLPQSFPQSAALGALLAYRLIYYLLPLLAATLALGAYEYARNHHYIRRAGTLLGQGIRAVAPQALAVGAFVGGLILLISGSTPAIGGRLEWLARILPLPVIEVSHFLASVFGGALLILAWGLQHRLDAAYYLSAGMLAAAAALSLLKGLDYEEAAILTVILIALVTSRREFYRKASLLNEPFSPQWVSAIAVALLSAAALSLFSYKHIDYSAELWWQFALHANAPRSLRAMVGALIVVLGFAIRRLLRPVAVQPVKPTMVDLDAVAQIAADSRYIYAYLALTGDKSILFGADRQSFLMYGTEGRSWVSLGDPIGRKADREELAWRFREMVDQHDGWTVFYQVRPENLPLYVDLGLAFLKLGEEARVPLAGFTLEGKQHKGMRRVLHTIERSDCTFEVVPASEVAPLIPQLKQVSDDWLARKHTREKAFSLGFFEPGYLCRLPLAVVRCGRQIVAFANILPGGAQEELSLDLMRYTAEAPKDVMEYLFLKLMLWGKEQGYGWFNLGMAPLSGLENRPLAPLWNRFGAAVFRFGEHFYNFQGLRAYKEKFGPRWEPRYLASPSGLALPLILTNVAALIGGGLRGAVTK